MASKNYTFKDFLRECREAIKIVWTKIWGEDLPKDMTKLYPDEEYNLGEQIRFYEQDKMKLAKKRRIATLVIIILSLISFNVIKDKIKYFIENNPTIACWNKPICIYDGPKLNYPSTDQVYIDKLEDNNYLIYKYSYGENILSPFKYKGEYKLITDLQKNKKIKLPVIEIYNPKKNHFYKINLDIPTEFFYIRHVYPNYKLLIENYNKDKFIIYDIKSKSFQQINPHINKDYIFLAKYDDNKDLYMTHYSDPEYSTLKPGLISRKNITQKEYFYLYNYLTFQYEQLSDFSINAKYFPLQQEDIIILKNKKIIIPFRKVNFIKSNVYFNNEIVESIWDHIEIYDPKTNKFYVEKNPYVLDKNLFNIELDNGNILFINQESAYIFNNKLNKFDELNKNEKLKIQFITNKILQTISNRYLYDTTKNIEQYINFIDLPQNKILIQCNLILSKEQKYKLCPYTIIYDHNTGDIYNGPEIPFGTLNRFYVQLNDNKIMLYGKLNYGEAGYFPLEKIKILKITNKNNKRGK